MGKKLQANSKAVEARDRKVEAKATSAAKAKQQEEDAEWAAHDNPRTKRDAKKEDEERRRLEAAAKKAEAKRLQQEEEAAMAAIAKKKLAPAKVTSHELHLQSEAEKRQREKDAIARANEARRFVTEEEYEAQVVVDNANREAVVVEARSLDAALEQLSVEDGLPADRHPEKRAKAAWEDYFAEQLPLMKEAKPGLKQMQYKNRIFEQWQRDPRNPRNQPKP